MSTQAHQDLLLDTIKRRGDQPISSLVDRLASDGMETDGDWGLYLPDRPNTVLWQGISESAATVISSFLGRDDVDPRPLSGLGAVMVFGWEGAPMLDLPIAEEIHPTDDFSGPHWLPLTVHIVKPGPQQDHTRKRVFKRVAFTRTNKIETWNKSHGHCWYCGKVMNPFDDFTIDHVHPVADGGTNDPSNLVPACSPCNSEKHAMPLERFRQRRGGGLFWFEVAMGSEGRG